MYNQHEIFNTALLNSKPKKGSTCGDECGDAPFMDVYKEHLAHRQIIFNETIRKGVIEKVVMQIEKFNYEDDEREDELIGFDRRAVPITLFINSPGGYVTDSLAVVAAIEQSRTPVVTVAQGQACSGAFLILAAGHARFAYKHCRLMYHQIAGGSWGKHQDIKETLEEMAFLQSRIDEILLRRTHLTAKQLAAINERKQDWFMWPEEALKHGIIDGIAPDGLVVPKQNKAHYSRLVEEFMQKPGGKKGGKK